MSIMRSIQLLTILSLIGYCYPCGRFLCSLNYMDMNEFSNEITNTLYIGSIESDNPSKACYILNSGDKHHVCTLETRFFGLYTLYSCTTLTKNIEWGVTVDVDNGNLFNWNRIIYNVYNKMGNIFVNTTLTEDVLNEYVSNIMNKSYIENILTNAQLDMDSINEVIKEPRVIDVENITLLDAMDTEISQYQPSHNVYDYLTLLITLTSNYYKDWDEFVMNYSIHDDVHIDRVSNIKSSMRHYYEKCYRKESSALVSFFCSDYNIKNVKYN